MLKGDQATRTESSLCLRALGYKENPDMRVGVSSHRLPSDFLPKLATDVPKAIVEETEFTKSPDALGVQMSDFGFTPA